MTAPGIVQGRLKKAAEVHRIKLRVDKPQDLAFEIETPAATMPRFNPIVRVLEPGGAEVVTNVHTKLNNNGLYMMKMIQAKTTVSLRNPGEYIFEIRDITTDCSGTTSPTGFSSARRSLTWDVCSSQRTLSASTQEARNLSM